MQFAMAEQLASKKMSPFMSEVSNLLTHARKYPMNVLLGGWKKPKVCVQGTRVKIYAGVARFWSLTF